MSVSYDPVKGRTLYETYARRLGILITYLEISIVLHDDSMTVPLPYLRSPFDRSNFFLVLIYSVDMC